MRRARISILGMSVFFMCGALFAQAPPPNPIAYVVPSYEFSPWDPTVTWTTVAGAPFRYVTGGAPEGSRELVAAVHLPDGASVTMIEVDGCDNSTSSLYYGALWSVSPMGGPGNPIIGTGSSNLSTGCAGIENFLVNPVTINNALNLYYLTIVTPPFDGTAFVTAVKVFYNLQVSQPPATATFNDVPTTDPGFQYIEALAAAQITAGCGGGNFCPDASVTRRQMAVFLAKVLGLYWPY
jgi:hypothetical protein